MPTATAGMIFLVTAMVLTVAIEAAPAGVNGLRVQRTPTDLCLGDNDLNSKFFNCPPTTCFVEKDDGRLKSRQPRPTTLPPANAMAKDTRSNAPTLEPENKLDMLKSCELENSPTSIRPCPQSNVFSMDAPVSFDPISTSRSCPPTRVNVHPITNGQDRDGGFSTVTDLGEKITQSKINKKKEEKTTTTVGHKTTDAPKKK